MSIGYIFKISDFFSAEKIRKKTKKKFKIITALSVFYDALNPNKFLKDVKNLLFEICIFIRVCRSRINSALQNV